MCTAQPNFLQAKPVLQAGIVYGVDVMPSVPVPPAHRQVPWQHAAASVPGHVPGERGERGDLPHRHEEHVQPQTAGAQEVRS